MKRIYLDYAAATPLEKEVVGIMKKFWNNKFANPNAIHKEGVEVKNIIEKSREKTALFLGVHSDEIIFTSGGTESNNLAIKGVIKEAQKEIKRPHIITSSIEHPSVLNVCGALEKEGVEVDYIKPNGQGILDPKEIKKLIKDSTVLISIMYANNEIGTIQPIKEIAKIIRQFKKQSQHKKQYPFFHTDACQAVNYLDINIPRLGIDLMSVSAAKFYGPKGIGFLYKKRSIPLKAIIDGGGQEGNFRSGTENTPLIVGLVKALEISQKIKEKESLRLTKLRNYFIESILTKMDNVFLNGHREERLANNVNFSFPGMDSEYLVLALDARGIACSSKSACQNKEAEDSYVIMSIRNDKKYATSSIRFSLGKKTNKRELGYVVKVLPEIIKKIK